MHVSALQRVEFWIVSFVTRRQTKLVPLLQVSLAYGSTVCTLKTLLDANGMLLTLPQRELHGFITQTLRREW